jgi:acyl carrier protein
MSSTEIEATIVELIRLRYPKLQLEKLEERPFQELGVDSIELLNLVFETEEKFGISIPNEALAGVRTAAALARVVEQLLAQAGQAAPGA